MIKLGAYVRGLRSALGRLSRSVRLSNGPYGGQGVFSSTPPASPEHAKIKESIMPAAVDPASTVTPLQTTTELLKGTLQNYI
jgi:hypothetical protein